MNVLIYNTEDEAKTRNHEEAVRRGCVTPKTLYWWSMREGENTQWALLVGGDPLQSGEEATEVDEDWFKSEDE